MRQRTPIPTKNRTENLPFEYYHLSKDSANFVVPFHYHSCQQLFRVIKGEVTIYANANTINMKHGDCVVLGANTVHACQPKTEDTEYEAFTFNLRDLFDLSKPHFEVIKMIDTHQLEVKMFYSEKEEPEITAIIGDVFEMIKNNKLGSGIFVMGKIFDVFGLLIDQKKYHIYENEVATRFYKHFLKSNFVFKFIYENYVNEITLEEMASSVELSEKYFCKFFKELTDLRPMEYLNKFRIDVASLRLITCSKSVNEVAQTCGFKDPCYFTKLFRRFKGKSPREYREENLAILKLRQTSDIE